MASVHHLQLSTTFVFRETCSFSSLDSMFLLFLLILCLHVTFYILKFGGKSSRLHWIALEGCLLYGIMPVSIEQWRAEIGSFSNCSLHSVVTLHLNLFNLLFNMFLVSFCIIAITVCYITKFKFFLSNHTIYIRFSTFSFNLYFL